MKPIVVITDHAVLRYLERVQGVDVEAIRSALAARLDQAARLGAHAVTFGGHTYVIAGGICPTVLYRKQQHRLRVARKDHP